MWEMWGLGMGWKWHYMQHYNFWILSTTNVMEEMVTRPGRQWDAYFSALHLAKEKPTQLTMQVTVHWVLWFCDIYQCPWFYSCMALFIIDDHFVSTQCWREVNMLLLHGINRRWSSHATRCWKEVNIHTVQIYALYCLCSTAHIVWVQHQFQMTREIQTQSHVIHTCSILLQTIEIPTGNHKGKKCGYLQLTPAQPSCITNILCTVTPWHYCHIYS